MDLLKRITVSALVVFLNRRHGVLVTALLLSLTFLGSCDDKTVLLSAAEEPRDLKILSKSELEDHTRAVQASIAQDPAMISTFRQQDIELALAKPDLMRIDGPTQVWQYRTEACVLDIYWRGRNAPVKSASHYEFRVRQGGDAQNKDETAPWHCVQTIIQKHDI